MTNESLWQLDAHVLGPAVAAFAGVIFFLAFTVNLGLLLYALRHPATLRTSSSVLLLNLALSNFVMTLFFTSVLVVSTATQKWLVGADEVGRRVTCQAVAFIFAYTTSLSIHTLAAISLDRCLLVTQWRFHGRWMTPKACAIVVLLIWIYSLLLDVTPFFGLGKYGYSRAVGICLPIWSRPYVAFFSAFSIIPLGIISVTTLWTCTATRRVIQRDYERAATEGGSQPSQKSGDAPSDFSPQSVRSVYTARVRNLFEIFGTLLASNALSLCPYIVTSVVGLAVGFERVPAQVYSTCLLVYLLSTVTNPIIQSYFRKDLRTALSRFCRTIRKKLEDCRKAAGKAKSDVSTDPTTEVFDRTQPENCQAKTELF